MIQTYLTGLLHLLTRLKSQWKEKGLSCGKNDKIGTATKRPAHKETYLAWRLVEQLDECRHFFCHGAQLSCLQRAQAWQTSRIEIGRSRCRTTMLLAPQTHKILPEDRPFGLHRIMILVAYRLPLLRCAHCLSSHGAYCHSHRNSKTWKKRNMTYHFTFWQLPQ